MAQRPLSCFSRHHFECLCFPVGSCKSTYLTTIKNLLSSPFPYHLTNVKHVSLSASLIIYKLWSHLWSCHPVGLRHMQGRIPVNSISFLPRSLPKPGCSSDISQKSIPCLTKTMNFFLRTVLTLQPLRVFPCYKPYFTIFFIFYSHPANSSWSVYALLLHLSFCIEMTC